MWPFHWIGQSFIYEIVHLTNPSNYDNCSNKLVPDLSVWACFQAHGCKNNSFSFIFIYSKKINKPKMRTTYKIHWTKGTQILDIKYGLPLTPKLCWLSWTRLYRSVLPGIHYPMPWSQDGGKALLNITYYNLTKHCNFVWILQRYL